MIRLSKITIFCLAISCVSITQAQFVQIDSIAYYEPPILVEHGWLYSLYVNLEYDVNFDLTFPIFDPNVSFSGRVWAVKRLEDSTLWLLDDFWCEGYANWEVDTTTGLGHYWTDPRYPEHHDILLGGYPGTYVLRCGEVVGLPVPLSPYMYWHNMDSIGVFDADTVIWYGALPHIKDITISQSCSRNWLPVIDGYIDETGHHNHGDFKVTLKAFFTTNDPPQSYKLRWVLQDISWYTGACMNYYDHTPNGGTEPDSLELEGGGGYTNPPVWYLADLMILGEYNPNYSCWYDTNRCAFYGQTNRPINNDEEISVVVTCYDFGAHGDIFIEAQVDSASFWYNLTKYQRRDSTWTPYSTIPIDEDNPVYTKCRMADFWKEQMLMDPLCPDTITIISQIEPTQDMDYYIHGVLPSERGDYLNTYEEYRGFYCKGIHTRTSPWEKDFFIYSDLDSSNFNTGIGYANLIGPGLCHLIDSTEMKNFSKPDRHHYVISDHRAINWYNDRIDSCKTCPSAILLNNTEWNPLSPDTNKIGVSIFWPTIPSYCIPETTVVGYVYTRRIRYKSPVHYDTLQVDLPQDSLAQLQVAGHEIGHMVNMGENPDSSSIMGWLRNWYNIPNHYQAVDLDSFLVKPRLH